MTLVRYQRNTEALEYYVSWMLRSEGDEIEEAY